MPNEQLDPELSALAIYCDDIRVENTGKSLILGIYSGNMLVSEFPVLLPSLVVRVYFSMHAATEIEWAKIVILKNDDEISKKELVGDFWAKRNRLTRELLSRTDAGDGLAKSIMTFDFKFSPFPIEGPCTLKARVLTRDGTLYAGGLDVRLMSDEERSKAAAESAA